VKRSVSIVAQCLLFLSSVAAYGAPQSLGAVPGATKAIFVAVPDNVRQAGTNSIEVIVELGGEVAIREHATFQNPPDRAVAVQILSYEPDELANLLQRAALGDDATVTVLANDRILVSSPLSALAADALKPLLAGASPIKLDGSHSDRARPLPHRPILPATLQGCRDACLPAFIQCDSACNSRPIPNCETRCDNRLANCQALCPCPQTHTYAKTTYSDQFLGGFCLTNSISGCFPGNVGLASNLYFEVATTAQHLVTENCDGSVTDTVTSTSSTSRDCYAKISNNGCFPTNCTPIGGCFGVN
jgi:hypothetical protein